MKGDESACGDVLRTLIENCESNTNTQQGFLNSYLNVAIHGLNESIGATANNFDDLAEHSFVEYFTDAAEGYDVHGVV